MNKTEALQTAETIFTQLGGQRTLKLFVGATNFAFNNLEKEERVFNYKSFDLPGHSSTSHPADHTHFTVTLSETLL